MDALDVITEYLFAEVSWQSYQVVDCAHDCHPFGLGLPHFGRWSKEMRVRVLLEQIQEVHATLLSCELHCFLGISSTVLSAVN